MDRTVLMDQFLKSGADEEETARGTTYFKSVGMALFDICAKKVFIRKSKGEMTMKVVATEKAPKALGLIRRDMCMAGSCILQVRLLSIQRQMT